MFGHWRILSLPISTPPPFTSYLLTQKEMNVMLSKYKYLYIKKLYGLAIFLTWDNEEKHAQKERNVKLIEENIQPYLSD